MHELVIFGLTAFESLAWVGIVNDSWSVPERILSAAVALLFLVIIWNYQNWIDAFNARWGWTDCPGEPPAPGHNSIVKLL